MRRHSVGTNQHYLSKKELAIQTAFHEAGHASAVYLRNQQKKLPPIYFEIRIEKSDTPDQTFSAKVVDGLLLHNLDSTILESLAELSNRRQHSYQCAYEADVINLLVGPLSEAKYVSIRDDEILTKNLIHPHCLHHYGGVSDVEIVHNHLNTFIADRNKRHDKLMELFQEAYYFIHNRHNWKCIEHLARFILECNQSTVSCEEIGLVFERCSR